MGPVTLKRLRWLLPGLAGIAFAILVSVLGQAPGKAADVPLSISISGNHFVNGAGQTIQLRGVNVSSSEYACADNYGVADDYYAAEPAANNTAAAIAAWGANVVRIPLNEDCWLNTNLPNGDPYGGAAYQQAIQSFVSDLNAHGIYAILDLHWTAPGTQLALEQQPMPDANHSPTFWTQVATAFKSNPAVIFDLFNEPYDPTDGRSGDDKNASDAVTWGCWDTGTKPDPVGGGAPPIPCSTQAYDDKGNPTSTYQIAGMQTLLNAVRNAGATQPVIVGGLNFADDLTQWADNAPDDLANGQNLHQEAASFHNYQGTGKCDNVDCWNQQIAPVAANVPVLTGEFAEDNFDESMCHAPQSTFDSDYMNWADTNGVSYVAWVWIVEDQAQQDADGCDDHALIGDYSGTPLAPNGTAVHDHLVALASGAGTTTTSSSTTTSSTTATTTATTTTKTTATNTTTTSASTTKAATTTSSTTTSPGGGGGGSGGGGSGGGGGGGVAPALASFAAQVKPGAAAVGFVLRSSQNATGTLSGQTVSSFAVSAAKQRSHRVGLGTVRFKLLAGKSKTVVLTLSKASRTLLARKRSLKVQITITLTSGARRSVTHRTLTLKAPARHKRKG